MFVSVPPALASPSPAAEPHTLPGARQGAHDRVALAASWFEQNWSTWLAIGLRILLIMVIAVVLRGIIRRTLTKLIDRMNRTAQAVDASPLGGLLVNVERRRQRSQAIGSVLRSAASFLVFGTAALMILSTFKINLAPLLASAGVAGVAVGFGARDLVTDFLAGVFMILEDQYGVGDNIDVGEASGEVIEIGLRVTKLRGYGGAIWYVRNGEIKRIGNLSQGWSIAQVDVTVRPQEDLEAVRSTLIDVGRTLARQEPWSERLWGPVEVMGLDSVLLDAAVVHLEAKTMPGQAVGVERELRWRIKEAFEKAGIPIVGRLPGQQFTPLPLDTAPEDTPAPAAQPAPAPASTSAPAPAPAPAPAVSQGPVPRQAAEEAAEAQEAEEEDAPRRGSRREAGQRSSRR